MLCLHCFFLSLSMGSFMSARARSGARRHTAGSHTEEREAKGGTRDGGRELDCYYFYFCVCVERSTTHQRRMGKWKRVHLHLSAEVWSQPAASAAAAAAAAASELHERKNEEQRGQGPCRQRWVSPTQRGMWSNAIFVFFFFVFFLHHEHRGGNTLVMLLRGCWHQHIWATGDLFPLSPHPRIQGAETRQLLYNLFGLIAFMDDMSTVVRFQLPPSLHMLFRIKHPLSCVGLVKPF